MAKKKRSSKKSPSRRTKSSAKRKPARRATARRGKKVASKSKSSSRKKTTAGPKKNAANRKAGHRSGATRVKKVAGKESPPTKTTRPSGTRRPRRPSGPAVRTRSTTRGLGAEAGGQSGDTEGLSRAALADSESVEELVEEGQAFEAGIISGVENAPDADKGGIRTRQVPEDDVPQEYLDED